MLPLIAGAGYPCYAVSLRGHGQSWQPGAFAFHVLTGIDAYMADVMAAINYLASRHPGFAPILVGHSMGGGILQRALSVWETKAAQQEAAGGLVLVASAPLSGGGLDVARNWQAAEASLAQSRPEPLAQVNRPQEWLPWLCSFFTINLNTGLETPAQVRNKFFSSEATDDTVCGWIRDSKSRLESIRMSIESFWPLADPVAVLAAIGHDRPPMGRKVLCISAEKDVLVTKQVSLKNYDAYRAAGKAEEDVMRVQLPGSAHHIMLDIDHERCAEVIVDWLQGKAL